MSAKKLQFSIALLKIGENSFTLDFFSPIKERDNEDIKEKGQLVGNRIIEKQIYDNR